MPSNSPPNIPRPTNRDAPQAQGAAHQPTGTGHTDELSPPTARGGISPAALMDDIIMIASPDTDPKPNPTHVRALIDAVHAAPGEATAIIAREFGADFIPPKVVETALEHFRDDPYGRGRVVAVMAEAGRTESSQWIESMLGSRVLAECAQAAISLLYLERAPDRGFRELERIVDQSLNGDIDRRGYPLDWICSELNRFGSAEALALSERFYRKFQDSTGL